MSIAGNSRSDTMEQASENPYRMLALDMDGTLLTSDKRISARTEQALRRAASRGVAVVLSTGRAASEVEDYREQLDGVVRYLSLLNGGVVRDFETNETLFAQLLPAKHLQSHPTAGRKPSADLQKSGQQK